AVIYPPRFTGVWEPRSEPFFSFYFSLSACLGLLCFGQGRKFSLRKIETMSTATPSQFRIEEDALGEVRVPAERLWGAQTQRSYTNFPIGTERFRWGRPVIRALGILKKCAALTNGELGQLPTEKVDLIVRAAQEVI